MPLGKEIKDNLTRQAMQNTRGLYGRRTGRKGEKEQVLLSERAHKQVFTVKRRYQA